MNSFDKLIIAAGWVIDVFNKDDLLFITYFDINNFEYGKAQIKLETNENIQFGDFIWWLQYSAFWTPADERFHDKKLKKIGKAKRLMGEVK